MPLHIVRLGSPRAPGEGLRIGTVRRTPQAWQAFARRYRREMAAPDAAHAIALLAALSQLAGLGRDADRCLEAAHGDEVRAAYARQTDRARALGLFDAPTFVCGDEIFWGDDRLDDAIDWARGAALPASRPGARA